MSQTSDARRGAANILKWFDPRDLDIGTLAFIMNRVSGIGLTVYLFLHLAVLSQLARGPQVYDRFIAFVKSPVFVASEFVVVLGAMLHGFNGLRIALTSLGVGVRYQKQLFIGLTALALAGSIWFALKMFGGEG